VATTYMIAGATGMIGAESIRQILQNQAEAKIFSLSRRAPSLTDKRLIHVPFDFSEKIQWPSEKPKAPIAICTLGTTIKKAGSQEAFRKVDFDFVVKFAELACELSATSFHLVTAHGASSRSSIFYNRVKGDVEAALQAMPLNALHIYRPSLLIGERQEDRPGEGFAMAASKFLGPLFKLPGLKAVAPTPATKLAQFILQCAEKNQSGKYIHSNEEILAA